jgi:hypothetical protein
LFLDEAGDEPSFVGQFLLHALRVEQVQHLRNAGLAHALAFAGRDTDGAAKEFQEVVIDLAVPELDGAGVRRGAFVFFGHARRLAERIEEHFGVHALQ